MVMQSINLKNVEKRAFRSVHQDGLLDMFLGLLFVAFGLGPLVRNEGGLSEGAGLIVYTGYVLIVLVAWWLGKKFITAPRIGLVKFSRARKRKVLNVRFVLLGSVVLGLVAFAIFASGNDITLAAVLGMFSLNILIVFGFMAYFLDLNRLYAYAVLWASSLPVGVLLKDQVGLGDAGYVFFVTGGVVVIVGIVLFVRFVRDYPLPPTGEESLNGLANQEG
jgi:hypothetical protein